MVRLFQNFDEEVAEAKRNQAVLDRAEATAATMTPMERMRLENQGRRNPTLPADAQISLALDPNGEALFDQVSVQFAGQASPRFGQRVTAGQVGRMPGSDTRGLLAATFDEATSGAAGFARVAMPNTGMAEVLDAAPTMGRGAGRVLGGAASVAGTVADRVTPDPVGSAARSGLSAVGDQAYDTLKGFSRNVMPALEIGEQLAQAKGRDVAAGVQGLAGAVGTGTRQSRLQAVADASGRFRAAATPNLSEGLAGQLEQTDAAQYLFERGGQVAQIALGREVTAGQDFGDGFFINEESALERRRTEAERYMGTLPNGQTYTIGRSIATAGRLDPESTEYSVVSGLLDAAVAIGAPGPEQAMARQLGNARGLLRTAAGGVDESVYLRDVGAYRGLFSQVDIDQATNFVRGSKSEGMVEYFASRTGDRGWNEIWEATGKGDSIDPYTVTRLTSASSADEVREILEQAVRGGNMPTLTTGLSRRMDAVGRATQRSGYVRRMTSRMPARTIDLMDPKASVTTIDDHARNIQAPRELAERWVSMMGRAENNIERRQVYGQIWAETADHLVDGGLPRDRARHLTQYMQNELSTSRASREDVLMMDAGAWSSRIVSTTDRKLPPMVLLNEAAEQLPMPDPRDLRRAVSWARPLWELSDKPGNVQRFVNVLGRGWQGAFDEMMVLQSKWKDMRLMRAGYPLRILPEGEMRRVAAGGTVINHPAGLFGYLLDRPKYGEALDGDIRNIRDGLDGSSLKTDDIFRAAAGDSRLFGLRPEAPTGQRLGDRIPVFRDGDNPAVFLEGWRDELLLLAGDEAATRVASRGVEETLDFLSGVERVTPPKPRSVPGMGAASADEVAEAESLLGAGPGGYWSRLRDSSHGDDLLDQLDFDLSEFFADAGVDLMDRTVNEIGSLRRFIEDLDSAGSADEISAWVRANVSAGSQHADATRALVRIESELRDRASRTLRELIDSVPRSEGRNPALGGEIRDRLIAMNPEMNLADPLQMRRYLESVDARIQAVTGGVDELLDGVKHGRLPETAGGMARFIDNAPEAVVMRSLLDADKASRYDRFVEQAFELLSLAPERLLLRGPEFARKYEQNLVELAPLAARPDDIIQAGIRANLSEEAINLIRRGAKGEGLLQLDHINTMAKRGALDHVRNLLYDTTKGTQFFDQMRLMSPFGEAWFEVVSSWTKLMTNDPFTPARRAGQAVRGLTSDDLGETYADAVGLDQSHLEEDQRNGFFYEGQNGDQVFYFPFSQELTERFVGVPLRMEAGARSLNLAGEVFPGLGVYSGIAANEVLPNDSSYDSLREFIFPFGQPPSATSLDTYMPAWMATMTRAIRGDEQMTVDQQRTYGSMSMQVMRYLASTGNYEQSEAGNRQLLEDTQRLTPRVFLIRGGVQALAPASPQIVSQVMSPDGGLELQSVMLARMRELQEEDYETSLDRFLDEFGIDNLLGTQGNTASTVYGGTPTEGEGYAWVRDNPDVVGDHPQLYGFFAPPGEGEEFSYEAYLRSLELGERVVLTDAQKLALAQDAYGSWEMRKARNIVGPSPTDEQQRILNALEQDLIDRFPGYQSADGIVPRQSVVSVIDDGHVDDALEDETLMAQPVGAALREYWELRNAVEEAAMDAGFTTAGTNSWRSVQAAEPYRELLNRAGEDLVSQEPQFARMWDTFLSREFKEIDNGD